MEPRLSVVVLTRNEARYVAPCVRSLLAESAAASALEVLIVDSASKDGTVAIAQALAASDRRVRVLALDRDVTIGEARNLGVREARGGLVAFLSADAEAAPGWLDAALHAAEDADVVYGAQEHAPLVPTVAAVSRGLRYHPFDRDPPLPPEAYASNVNAVYRRAALARFPFPEDRTRSALDDVLLARRAREAGLRVAYAPGMVALHRDVDSLRAERSKVRREARGWGVLRREVGWNAPVLAWGAGVGGLGVLAAAAPGALTLGLLAAALWAPGVRRLVARQARYPLLPTLGALAIAPFLDLQFLYDYLRGLAAGAPPPVETPEAMSVEP